MANPARATSSPKAVADKPEPDELRAGLIQPAYREFCRDNGLETDAAELDFELYAETISMFNQLKPHFSEYKGQVVQFQLWSWNGDFNRTVQPMTEFLAQAAQNQARLARFEKWFAIIADTCVFLLALVCAMEIDRLAKVALPGWLVTVVFIIAGGFTWRWFFFTRPKKLKEIKQAALESQLSQLRQKLVAKRLASQIKR